jgi:hypothetical protein
MRIIVTSLLFLALSGPLFAQSYSIRGRAVSEGDNAPLRSANVVLFQLPDSSSRGTVTDANGRFEITSVKPGDYLLRVSYIGYATVSREITVRREDVTLGRIALKEDDIRLGEVEVTGKAPAAVLKEDTLEYDARAYKISRDASAEQLVEKMPGITVESGTVKSQGEEVKKVMVDNREFFGDDARAVLRNIPAEVIEKIQVYDRQSDQARFTGFSDGNDTKTINIITREMMRNAKFGKLYGGAGENSLYRAGGIMNFFNGDQRISLLGMTNNVNEQNFSMDDVLGVMGGSSRFGGMRSMMSRTGFNPGAMRFPGGFGGGMSDFMVSARNGIATTHAFGINYSDKWGETFDATASYFFNYSNNDASNALLREYVLSGLNGQLYDELELSESNNMNHRLSMRVEWKIDSLNSLLYTPRLSMQQNDGNTFTTAASQLAGMSLNNGQSAFTSDLTGMNLRNELLYRRSFETRGRTFSIRLTNDLSNNEGDNALVTRYETFGQGAGVDSVDQRGILDKKGLTLGADMQYTEPLSERSQLLLKYENSWSDDNSDKKTYNLDVLTGFYDILDPLVSNEFASNYFTQSFGTGYRFENDDAQINLDASWQTARLNSEQQYPFTGSLDRTFNTIMPRAMLRWKISKTSEWRMFYRTRTSPPSVDQLQDVLDNSNPLQLSIGNPALDQSYSHFLGTRYSTTDAESGGYFFTFLSGSTTSDYVSNSSFIARTDTTLYGISLPRGAQLTRPVNLDGNYSFRTFMTYGRPVSWLQSNVNLNLMASYSRTPSMINEQMNYAYQPSVAVGLVVASNISEDFDFTISTQTNLNWVENSLRTDVRDRYINQNTRFRLNWTFLGGFVFNSELSHNSYSGLSEGYNDQVILWNLSLGRKFLADDQAELKLTVFDVLKQNQNIIRNVTETYIEDTRSNVLQRYALLTFSYTIRSFGPRR